MSNTSKINAADIAAFFSDPDASDAVFNRGLQINAPLVGVNALTVEEMMRGGAARIVLLNLDRSLSMEPVAHLVRTGFREEFIPALKEASADDIAALRIGGMSFASGQATPMWHTDKSKPLTFHSLENLPVLQDQEYDTRGGHATALHRSIIDATALGINSAAIVKNESGTTPEVDIIHFTDGENNEAPMSEAEVRRIIVGARGELVRHILFYFDTSMGRDDPSYVKERFERQARLLGYDVENIMAFIAAPGEDQRALRSRFRRMMRVMSKVSASKGTSAVVAAAAIPATADLL